MGLLRIWDVEIVEVLEKTSKAVDVLLLFVVLLLSVVVVVVILDEALVALICIFCC